MLFTDAQHVLQLAEIFFREVYGATKVVDSKPSSETPASKSNQTFNLLLARKHSASEQTPTEPNGSEILTPLQIDHAPTIPAFLEDQSLKTAQGSTRHIPSESQTALSDIELPHADFARNDQASVSTWKGNMYARTYIKWRIFMSDPLSS